MINIIIYYYQILDRNRRSQLTAKQFQDLFDSVSRQQTVQVSDSFQEKYL